MDFGRRIPGRRRAAISPADVARAARGRVILLVSRSPRVSSPPLLSAPPRSVLPPAAPAPAARRPALPAPRAGPPPLAEPAHRGVGAQATKEHTPQSIPLTP